MAHLCGKYAKEWERPGTAAGVTGQGGAGLASTDGRDRSSKLDVVYIGSA